MKLSNLEKEIIKKMANEALKDDAWSGDFISRIFWSYMYVVNETYVISYNSWFGSRALIYIKVSEVEQIRKSIIRDIKIEKILKK